MPEFKAPTTKRKQTVEEDFPRGGATGLTPLEFKEVARQAEDSLFADGESKTGSKDEPAKKKRKPSKKHANAEATFENTFDKKLNVEILSFKRLTVGTIILGCITQIARGRGQGGTDELVVALPNNLTGYVSIADLSAEISEKLEDEGEELPDLSSMFHVGQWVLCAIVELQEAASGASAASGSDKHRRKIILTLMPHVVNAGIKPIDVSPNMVVAGSIQSVEDRGYIVSLGIHNMHGFIKNAEAKMYQRVKNNDQPLQVGQVVLCSVTAVEESKRTAQLTIDTLKVAKGFMGDKFTYSEISSIVPGTVIDAHITSIQDKGVLCNFMGHFDATIDYFHTAQGIIANKKDLEDQFKINSTVRARILYVDLSSTPNRIGLTNAKHAMALSQPDASEDQPGAKVYPQVALPVGHVFESVTIKRIDEGYGLMCEIEGTAIPGFVHISRVADDRIPNLSAVGKYRLGTSHRAAVMGYDPVDGVLQLSMQPSILSQPFLRVEDVKVGALVKGTVMSVMDKGVVVQLAKGIRGFIPTLHCVDAALTERTSKTIEERYKVGKTVNCRVLSTDPEKGKVGLTCKDSLIKSKQPLVTSYEGAEVGTLADGVVYQVNPKGVIVSFYNNVKAFAHISELSETHVADVNLLFKPGQVKTCRILSVDPANNNIKVSFRKSSEVDLGSVEIGSLQRGKIMAIKEEMIHLSLKPSEIKAVLHKSHLSDHLGDHSTRLLEGLKDGHLLTDLVVLKKDDKRGSVVVSKKPLLVLAAKANQLVKELSEVKPGDTLAGFVRGVTAQNVYVEFANGLSAVAFRQSLSDQFVTDANKFFVRNQSVLAKVLRVDPAENKIEISLKPSEINASTVDYLDQAEFLGSYFKQLERLVRKNNTNPAIAACVLVEVQQMESYGWIVSISEGKDGFVTLEQAKGIEGKKGLKTVAKVLDVDFEKEIVDFTLRKPLISKEEQKVATSSTFVRAVETYKKSIEKLDALKKDNKSVDAVVELVKDNYLVLSIPHVNHQIAFAATKSYNNREEPFMRYKAGQHIKARIAHVPSAQLVKGAGLDRVLLAFDQQTGAVRASLNENGAAAAAKKAADKAQKPKQTVDDFEDVKVGEVLSGRIATIQHTGLNIHLGGKVFGRIHLTDIADEYTAGDELVKKYKKGQMVSCVVIGVDKSNRKIDLSVRPSRLEPQAEIKPVDPEIKSMADLSAGQIVRGFVSNVADKGCFIALNHKLSGRVMIAELSDDYLKDWKSHFTVGQLVKAKILSVNEARNQIELTLKASQIDPSIKPLMTLADFQKGQKVKGSIKAVKPIGVFIKIDGSNVSGLCHISEISENHVPDVSKLYTVGDPVKAKILDIDMDQKRISFGLKSSYFEEGDAEEEGEESEDEDEEVAEGSDVEMEDADEDIEMGSDDEEDEDEDEDEDDEDVENIFAGHDDDSDEDDEEDADSDDEKAKKLGQAEDSDDEMTEDKPLAVSSGFSWDGQDVDMGDDTKSDDESGSDSDSDDEANGASKKQKKKAKKHGAAAPEDDKDLASAAPQMAADYERLLLGSPNSSYLWINYMAFQLQLSEIAKAREIGQRALKTISFREEQEKMNVWVALMNLENTFGTSESLEEVFKKALQTLDQKKVYLQLVKIYERSNKLEAATELYQTMTKKFGQSSKIWTGFGHFQLAHGHLEAGRELLQRSLKSLPKRKHIKTVSKFAQLEFKYGEPERGRTIFEGVMSNYPKRVDLWSIYIDMEVRNGEQDAVRRLFARVVSLKLSSKKMKFFFKKWLAYEKDHGDEDHIEEVKRRALAYVESLTA
ncbi:rRNA biogenesis protein rrp5 [Actinomortierella ambigua]|nr:rRNA biogenesis protein rrp5 [Actinomortierella ambigua]